MQHMMWIPLAVENRLESYWISPSQFVTVPSTLGNFSAWHVASASEGGDHRGAVRLGASACAADPGLSKLWRPGRLLG